MKLISMTDLVLQGYNINQINNYAYFLKQPLKIEMFVPCVDNEVFNYSMHGNKEHFEESQQKVLFEGFQYCNDFSIRNGVYWINLNEFDSIEDLVKYDLTLTQSAINTLGL